MGNYFFTTLINAVTKLGPYVLFIVGGYFVFVKLPFLFLKKSMDDQKKKLQEDDKNLKLVSPEKVKVIDHKKKEEPKKEKPKTEQKQEAPKKPAPRPMPKEPTPEEVFQIKENEILSASDLKKRYFDLLKQNHPDRVASMGSDFKTLAEKNTKDINKAYEKLKKKAS